MLHLLNIAPNLTPLAVLLLVFVSAIASSLVAALIEKYWEKPLTNRARVFLTVVLSVVSLGTAYFADRLQSNPSSEVFALEKLATIESQQATIIAVISRAEAESDVSNGTPDIVGTEAVQTYFELDATRGALISEIAGPVKETPSPPSTLGFPSGAALGSTFLRNLDNMKMLYVPGGTYLMGSSEGDLDAEALEKPQHRVTVNGFWLDETEVTISQYAQFLNAKNPDEQQLSTWIKIDSEYSQINIEDALYRANQDIASNSVVDVSWFGANEYCNWAGGRLPSEEEWEYAARGPQSLTYPWGNSFSGSSLNFCDVNCPRDWRNNSYDDGYSVVAPVGSYPSGKSWVSAFDLAGNVAEWTANGLYAYSTDANWSNLGFSAVSSSPDEGFHKVVRGGSWANTYKWTRSAYRAYPNPKETSEFIGFRCIASP